MGSQESICHADVLNANDSVSLKLPAGLYGTAIDIQNAPETNMRDAD